MPKQTSLLNETETLLAQFRNRSIEDTTFLGKLSLPIHRWYRLTASFSPNLARDILDFFQPKSEDTVLDPFCGVGTVPLVAKQMGLKALGVEINPFLAFVARAKLANYSDLEKLQSDVENFMRRYKVALEHASKVGAKDTLDAYSVLVPQIHNPFRWWSLNVLRDLVLAKKTVTEMIDLSFDHMTFIKMGILSILIAVSNAEHNHVSLTFLKQPKKHAGVLSMLDDKLREMLHDIRSTMPLPSPKVEVLEGNSRSLAVVMGERKADIVITSPPYPNRFSYARETRPHLFFFNFVPHRDAVSDLEVDAIGGTWGKATSVLTKRVDFKSDYLDWLLRDVIKRIRRKSEILANYVVKYFNDMEEHSRQVARVTRGEAKLAYVIGNSKFYGYEIQSDEVLGSLFGRVGFSMISIERMRKRNSKSGLYEAVVLMHKNSS